MLHRQYLRSVPLPKDLTGKEILVALENTQNFFYLSGWVAKERGKE